VNYFIKRLVAFTNSRKKEEHTANIIRAPSYLQADYKSRFVIGCFLVSLGILVSASGGSWDITNHLLNKPETFFAPPHAVLYTGIAFAILGSVIILRGWRSCAIYYPQLRTSVRLVITGILMLIMAGPVDFGWHSAFGLDGLLSPPHFVLVMGMIMSSIGAMLGIIKYNNNIKINISSNSRISHPTVLTGLNKSNYYSTSIVLTVIGILPVWLSTSGLIGMFTLPFSNTKYFDFNPEPSLAVTFATLGYPFLISLILFSSFELTRRKFGILSITGTVYLTINALTAIMPSESLLPTLPFYIINIIPIIVADVALSISSERFYYRYIAGALLGASFFMIHYPLITHTYNELLTKQPVWPSVTASIYFGMIGYVYPLVVMPAVTMGILGVLVGHRLIQRAMYIRSS
jgi:hypothetical protein